MAHACQPRRIPERHIGSAGGKSSGTDLSVPRARGGELYVTSEPNSVDDHENAVEQGANGEVNGMPAETDAGEAVPGAESGAAGPGDPDAHDAAPGDSAPPEPAPPEPGRGTDDLLAQVASATQEVAAAADRYHTRAEQREGVIDYLRSELDLLRRGERRGLLRPVLAEL